MKSDEDFFEEPTEQSLIKVTIVKKYFTAWASVIAPSVKNFGKDKIAYIDLFAGKGKYDDGTDSTPILVLKTAVEKPILSEMLMAVFNEFRKDYYQELCQAIKEVPGIENLRHQPETHNIEVGALTA